MRSRRGKSPDEKIDTRGGKNGANTTIQTVFHLRWTDKWAENDKGVRVGAISGKSA